MKISFITLGCKTNQYESEKMASELAKAGFFVSFGFEFADCYVLNTCSVTAEADKKSRQLIAKVNKLNPNCSIIVCGCSSENNDNQFKGKKNVVLVLGTKNKFELVEFLMKNKPNETEQSIEFRTRKYLKIQDGCNNFCTYCIIPYLRGRELSRPIEDIVFEAKTIEKTCKEIVLTGINISAFGRDYGKSLTDLILALKDVNSRIRIGSLEANVITQDFLNACKQLKNFCPHFHLSMQSGSDYVLKSMNRHYNSKEFCQKIELIKNNFENPFIACDLIVGFPTETDNCFNETLKTLNNVEFSFMHIFPYSARTGTIAFKMAQLNPAVVQKREEVLKTINQKYNERFIKSWLGKDVEVLIEQLTDGKSVGFSREYVKCYFDGVLEIGQTFTLKVDKIFKDGVLVK